MSKDIKEYLHFCINAVDYRVRYVDNAPGTWSVWSRLTPGRYARAVEDFSVSEIQIALRKLESMTDAESGELNDFMWDGFPDAWQNLEETLKMFLHPWDGEYRPAFPVYVKALNWLRSKGFDCDELIENGLAIDKETLTP